MAGNFIHTWADACYRAIQGKSRQEVEAIARRALEILQRKRLLRDSRAFFTALDAARLRHEKKVAAIITSKYPLAPTEVKLIVQHVEKTMRKEVEVTLVVDPSLLGGCKIRCGDMLFDATIDHSLMQLQSHLTTNRL